MSFAVPIIKIGKLPMTPKKKTIKKSVLTPTILIAGGAGFIGSHLAEMLLMQNARVIVLDNLNNGKEIHVNSLLTNPNFALFDVDLNKGIPKEIESVDYIFHLGGVETYMFSNTDISLESLLMNSVGTKNLLDLANKSEAKFLLVSSIDVYQGMIASLSLEHYFGQTEQEEKKYSLTEAKRYAEALVWEYYKKNHTNVRIVRIPEIYGPRMDLESHGDLGRFLKDILEDRDLTLLGDGNEKYFYLFVTDLVAGLIKALFNENTEGRIYSLVDKEPFTVLETIYLVKNLANKEVKIDFKAKLGTNLSHEITPDTSNLKDLKWDPKTPFKEGLVKTLKWFGYTVNENSFKPAKLIEEKQKEKQGNFTNTLFQQESPTLETTPEQIHQLFDETTHEIPKARLSLKTRLSGIFARLRETSPKLTTPSTQGKSVAVLNGLLAVGFVIFVLTIFVGIPSLQTVFYTKRAKENLEQVPNLLLELKPTEAKASANKAFQELHKAQNSIKKVKWVFAILGKNEYYTSANGMISSGKHFAKALYNTAKATQPFTEIWAVLRPDSTLTLDTKQLDESKLHILNAKEEIQLAKSFLGNLKEVRVPTSKQKYVDQYINGLEQAGAALNTAEALTTDLPNLIGMEKMQRYLVLFQNSNEIRPTGGFIGSYAVLELEKGKIKNLTIDDIYNPDGQIDLKGIEIPAPEPIATILGEKNLHIRNANWNPDFEKSAALIQELFYKMDGSRFDGVTAIDLFFAKNLLKTTGPVFLTAYNEEITENNLYEKTQFYSEFNYKEGVSQKKSFLTILGSKMMEKLFALPKEKMPALVTELGNSLRQRHVQIYLPNSSFNALLQKNNWTGKIINTDTDYLQVVNTNLGGTKANYYVKNKLDYKVNSQTRDGILRGTLTATYKHTGKDYAWPGGPYKNYVRVLVPAGTKLTGAKIESSVNASKDVFKEMIIGTETGYTTFEIPLDVQPQETSKLTISFDLASRLSITEKNKTYKLVWQKQAGTENDEASFSFEAPLGLTVTTKNPSITISGRKALYTSLLNNDLGIELMLE